MNENKAEKLLEFLEEVTENLKELAEKKKKEEEKSDEKQGDTVEVGVVMCRSVLGYMGIDSKNGITSIPGVPSIQKPG